METWSDNGKMANVEDRSQDGRHITYGHRSLIDRSFKDLSLAKVVGTRASMDSHEAGFIRLYTFGRR